MSLAFLGLEWNDSITAGEFVVGLRTLALAAFTAWLGLSTRASAKAAEEAVEQAEEPYVIATPTPAELLPRHRAGEILPLDIHRWANNPSPRAAHTLRLRLWNIGAGPAIVQEVRLISHERRRGDEVVLAEGLEAHVPIAAHDAADVRVPSPRWREPGTGVLRIEYSHSNGNRYVTNSDVGIEGDLVRCLSYPRYGPQRGSITADSASASTASAP